MCYFISRERIDGYWGQYIRDNEKKINNSRELVNYEKNKGLQVVTHPSTDQAQCCLTSVIKGQVALAVCNTVGYVIGEQAMMGSDYTTMYPVLQA